MESLSHWATISKSLGLKAQKMALHRNFLEMNNLRWRWNLKTNLLRIIWLIHRDNYWALVCLRRYMNNRALDSAACHHRDARMHTNFSWINICESFMDVYGHLCSVADKESPWIIQVRVHSSKNQSAEKICFLCLRHIQMLLAYQCKIVWLRM